MPLRDELLVYATTFVAGLLNATVGSGGLLQVPMLMLVLPAEHLAVILGTSKLAGLPGLGAGTATFARRLKPAWPLIVRAGLAEIPLSMWGAHLATRLNPEFARPMALVIIVTMSAFVLFQPGFGQETAPRALRLTGWTPWAIGAAVGFYEGFFGSGTGTILIVLFVTVNGLDLTGAAVASAFVTLAGVVAAVGTYYAAGTMLVPLALRMAVFNIAGALIGAHFITLKGSGGLRRLLIAMLVLLVAKLAWDQFTR